MELTPREKAKEIIRRHYDWVDSEYEAKQNALITVDEIIKEYEENIIYTGYDYDREMRQEQRDWWLNVKEEINKL